MKKNKVFVVGGDDRQYYLATELWKKGFRIACYGMEKLEELEFVKSPKTLELGMIDNDVILLPVPILQDNLQIKSKEKNILLKELERNLRKGQILFGGKIPESLKEVCKEKQTIFIDYMELEEIARRNAVATGEGAIMEAMRLSRINIQGSNCLVIGFGRCGEVLAEKLSGLGAEVTVMARSEEARNKGEFCGYKTSDMFKTIIGKTNITTKNKIPEYQFIFNTVPALIIDKTVIDSISNSGNKEESPIIIDIASAPGGVDFDYCKKKSIEAGLYLGIPGKYAPKTSGVILAGAVMKELDMIEGNQSGCYEIKAAEQKVF